MTAPKRQRRAWVKRTPLERAAIKWWRLYDGGGLGQDDELDLAIAVERHLNRERKARRDRT